MKPLKRLGLLDGFIGLALMLILIGTVLSAFVQTQSTAVQVDGGQFTASVSVAMTGPFLENGIALPRI